MLFAFLHGSSWFRGLRRPSAKLQYNFQYRFPPLLRARLFPNHAEYDTFCITVSFHRGGKGGNVCCGGRGGIFSACFPFGLLMCRTRLFFVLCFLMVCIPILPKSLRLVFRSSWSARLCKWPIWPQPWLPYRFPDPSLLSFSFFRR